MDCVCICMHTYIHTILCKGLETPYLNTAMIMQKITLDMKQNTQNNMTVMIAFTTLQQIPVTSSKYFCPVKIMQN